jgi:hypothetical protein
MAAPKQAQSTLTERQLGFVFSNQSEPRYSFNGWVYEAIDGDSETDGQPVWFGKGITKLSTRDGITHRQKKGTDPTACVDLLAAYQYYSFRPLPLGMQIQHNAEDDRVLDSLFVRLDPTIRDQLKWWIRQLSPMNQ